MPFHPNILGEQAQNVIVRRRGFRLGIAVCIDRVGITGYLLPYKLTASILTSGVPRLEGISAAVSPEVVRDGIRGSEETVVIELE
jgi:hypothetical protein